jgi:hypothetical protein
LRRAKDWIRRNAAFTFPFAISIYAYTISTVYLWSGGIPKEIFSTLENLFHVYILILEIAKPCKKLNTHDLFLS